FIFTEAQELPILQQCYSLKN
ncbi:hypothetical protein EC890511_4852, partial [Escherichia coli 89.0511]